VGEYFDAGIGHTLILHWDGSSWQLVASPDLVTNGTINSTTNELNGVAVIAPNDAWAVGYGVSSNVPYQTMTLHWDGTAWNLVASPNVATPGYYNALNDVAAVSSNDVWAVGGVPVDLAGAVTGQYSVLMHWDGSTWQLSGAPSETVTWSDTTRLGATARATNDVWAVGRYYAWHWDGSGWQVSANSGQNLRDIHGSSTGLWSVGTYPGMYIEGGYYPPSPVALYLSGTSWVSTSPVVPDPKNGAGFNSVKVIAADDVWAVGQSGLLAITEKWDGTRWSVVPAAQGDPNSTGGNVLLGVTAFSPTALWAVGYYYDTSGSQRALIERYTCAQ
jgi:hypothetical protein